MSREISDGDWRESGALRGKVRRDVPSDCPSVIALQVGKRSGGPSTPAKDLGLSL